MESFRVRFEKLIWKNKKKKRENSKLENFFFLNAFIEITESVWDLTKAIIRETEH